MGTEKQDDEESYIGRESMSIKSADGQYVNYGSMEYLTETVKNEHGLSLLLLVSGLIEPK